MVKGPGKSDLGEVSGRWNSVIEYADKKSGKKGVMFDANAAKSVPKTVLPESEQEENESRRWVRVRVLRLFHCHEPSLGAVAYLHPRVPFSC
jgi:hypothetical protein